MIFYDGVESTGQRGTPQDIKEGHLPHKIRRVTA